MHLEIIFLRLGWSYKDKEIFTLDESIKYFNLRRYW